MPNVTTVYFSLYGHQKYFMAMKSIILCLYYGYVQFYSALTVTGSEAHGTQLEKSLKFVVC